METLTIALSADRTFFRQLAVVITGVSRWCDPIRHDVYVLHDGIDATLQERVAQSAGEHVHLEWIDANTPGLDDARTPSFLPMATVFRLRLEELLPTDCDRVIYLDTDTVVRRPLTELWRVDLADNLLGAVRDPFLPWAGSPQNLDWRSFGIAPDSHYFNSGVMLIPLRRWRAEGVSDQAWQLVTNHLFGDVDQAALNIVANGRWRRLHPRWNLQGGHVVTEESHAWVVESRSVLEAARRDPAVIHYNRGSWRKPWEDRGAVGPQGPHPYRDLWFEDLDRTHWARWRPDDSRPSRLAGVSRRVKRAARALIGASG